MGQRFQYALAIRGIADGIAVTGEAMLPFRGRQNYGTLTLTICNTSLVAKASFFMMMDICCPVMKCLGNPIDPFGGPNPLEMLRNEGFSQSPV